MTMRLQEIATSVGVALINYGEETQACYEVKLANNMGQVDVAFLRSKDDVALVVRELMAQDANLHASQRLCGYHPVFAEYINYPNPFPHKTVIGTCRKAAKATEVEQVIEDYNATHSQVLTVNRLK